MSKDETKSVVVVEDLYNEATKSELIVRSQVPPQTKHTNYRKFLRRDFYFSCAYCTITESEATARRFTIDHYEPVSARPDLSLDYSNLMYSCEECNLFKGDRTPPQEARDNGVAFFRPDNHKRSDHFTRERTRLKHKTKVGDYTIEALDLNRASLQRLRDLRARIADCEEFISSGITALRSFPIDHLPREIRAKAISTIKQFSDLENEATDELEKILQHYARSPLDGDDDEDPAADKERLEKLRQTEALYKGVWRGRKHKA